MVSKTDVPNEEVKQFNGRKTTVFKKAEELSTLCDVDVLLICYDPDAPNTPQIWCSKPDPSYIVNEFFKRTKMEKGCVNLTMSSKNLIGKMSLESLKNLNWVLAGKIENVQQRIDMMMKVGHSGGNYSVQSGNIYCEVGKYGVPTSSSDCGNNNKIMNDFSESYSIDDVGSFYNGNNGKKSGNFDDGLTLDDLSFKGCDPVRPIPQNSGGGNFKDQMKSCDGGLSGFGSSDQVWTSPEQYDDATEIMIDIFDSDDIRFVNDDHDLDMIKQLATVDDRCDFGAQIGCY